MKCFAFFAAAVTLACSAIVSVVDAADAAPDGGKNWSYKINDKDTYGPAAWGQKFPACAGKRQSPIDIVPKNGQFMTTKEQESPLKFSGQCPKYKVKQLYDAFKVETAGGSCKVAVDGKSFNFVQAHFHAPAEHTINGKAPDAEIHYVHQAADKSGFLVVGLFFEKKAGVKTDPFVLNFFHQIKHANTNKTVDATLTSYFPSLESTIAKGSVYNYPGSLTTPGCDEVVDWWVVEKPLLISASDFASISADLKRIQSSDNGKAARPVQPLNGRVVKIY